MAIKALVSGDLHLGKRSAAVPVEAENASTKHTWKRMVQYAVENQIDMVLLTGDIVDQDNKFYEAIEPLQEGFNTLGNAGIDVYMVAGNHDYDVLPRIVSMNATQQIHLLGQNGKWEQQFFTKGQDAVRIIGWSFPGRYVDHDAVASFPVDDLSMPSHPNTSQHPDSLSRAEVSLQRAPQLLNTSSSRDIPTIALVHGDIYQATSRYNPLRLEALKNHTNVQAWLLGHIHKTAVVNREYPLMLYPGSPHALSAKEQDMHGFYELTIEGKTLEYKYVPVSPVCYESLTVDVTSVEDETAFRTRVVDTLREATGKMRMQQGYQPDFLVYDLLFTGAYDDILSLQNWGEAVKGYSVNQERDVIIRSLSYDIRPVTDIEHLSHDPSYPGVLAQAIRALESGEGNAFTRQLTEEWKERFRRTTASAVFLPLHLQPGSEEIEQMAREHVLKACKTLIGELNIQRNEN